MLYFDQRNNATKYCDSDEWYTHYPIYMAQDYAGNFHIHGHFFGWNYPYSSYWQTGVIDGTLYGWPYMPTQWAPACGGPGESGTWMGWRNNPQYNWNDD